jgi:hypothetical protein
MRNRLASEWEVMGWEWDLQVGGYLLDQLVVGSPVSPAVMAEALPSSYLSRYRTDRQTVQEAIERAIGDEVLDEEQRGPAPITLVVHGDNYTVSFGDNATFEGSPLNIGPGTQLNLDSSSDVDELLRAIGILVTSGLGGQWDSRAALAVEKLVKEHGGLTVENVRSAVIEAGEAAGADAGRIQELTEKVAVSGLGSFLSVALSSGLADLLHQLG